VNDSEKLAAIEKGVGEAFWAFIDLTRDISTLDAVKDGTESAVFRFLTENRAEIIEAIGESTYGLFRDQLDER
jgi:hypothetical protein